jgi:very-short-patch-repair endonuclease
MRRSRARSREAIEFAKQQRATANEFSSTVWQWLRNRQCHGQKFRREFPIPPYTVDFCCVELQFIVEVDGKHHETDEGRAHDGQRDRFLKQLGYQVLRVKGYEVLREDSLVLQQLRDAVLTRMAQRSSAPAANSPSPPNPLSPQRGEGE